MEELKVLDYSNVFIASYFTDDRQCSHSNREHTLIYLCSGELEIEERGKKTILHEGECAFMRRDNQMYLHKHVKEGKPYHSVVLKFSRNFCVSFIKILINPYCRNMPGGIRKAYACCLPDAPILKACSNPFCRISIPG